MNVLTAHIGHRLTAKDERHLRCLDCAHTLVLPSPTSTAGSTSTSTAPRRDEKCPTHAAGFVGACIGCAADAKARADDAPPVEDRRPDASFGIAAARAVLRAHQARKAQQ